MADAKNLPKPDSEVGGYLVSKEGGKTVAHEDGSKGGLMVGKRHSEGGIQMDNTSTNQKLEAETGEVLLTNKINNSSKTYNLDGKELTAKQVASTLNSQAGGVKFRSGGTIGANNKPSERQYKFGGKMMTDQQILSEIAKDHVVDKTEGKPLQVAGGSIIITRPAVLSADLHDFNGSKKKVIDILSEINVDAGGKPFSLDDASESFEVKASDKTYEYGGKTMTGLEVLESCGCKHSKGAALDTKEEYLKKQAIESAGKKVIKTINELKSNNNFNDEDVHGVIRMHSMELADDVAKKKAKISKKTREAEYKVLYPQIIKEVSAYVSIYGKEAGIKMEAGGKIEIGKLSEGKTLADIAAMHGVTEYELKEEMRIGIKHEMHEHTDNKVIAMRIALDHLVENPYYYTKLQQFEEETTPDYEEHLDAIIVKMAEGGQVDKVFSFSTPTGKPTKLRYIEQVLVRTKKFKEYFGDWESAAKYYLYHKEKEGADETEVFHKYYEGISKVIDFETLEPKVVHHGSMSAEEFFIFDVTKEKGVGRPYAYFAVNKEYAQNFNKVSQRGEYEGKRLLYSAFLNIRKPFMAIGHSFDQRRKGANYWLTEIKGVITYDKYGDFTRRKELDAAVDSQIKDYVQETFGDDNRPFWTLMARDRNKDFKYFLMSYGFDGVAFSEEISSDYDAENPAQFTYAYTVFDARQIKLADGRNVDFDPMKADIRYEKGGKILNNDGMENIEGETEKSRLERLRKACLGENYKEKKAEQSAAIYKLGGTVGENKETISNFDAHANHKRNPNMDYVDKLIERSKANS